jgi:hypothetical protein
MLLNVLRQTPPLIGFKSVFGIRIGRKPGKDFHAELEQGLTMRIIVLGNHSTPVLSIKYQNTCSVKGDFLKNSTFVPFPEAHRLDMVGLRK